MVTQITRGGMVVAAALAFLACSGDAFAQGRGRGEPRCFRELSANDSAANDPSGSTCREAAKGERGINAVRARFYSGRAFARAGDLENAISQLVIAANAGRDFPQLTGEVRAAKLELAQAYRQSGKAPLAESVLQDMSDGDPAVAHQKALLALATRGEAGQQSAFDLLDVFAQDDRSLLIAMGPSVQPVSRDARTPAALTPSPAVAEEIRRGRSWLYRLGTTLGKARLNAGDPRSAINYFGPVADAVNRACPEPGPIQCANGVTGTTSEGTNLLGSTDPSADDTLRVFFDLGIASLRSAGLQDTLGLGGVGGQTNGIGSLDCIGSTTGADAPIYFEAASRAFEAYIRRSGPSAAPSSMAHWGLACTILASQAGQTFGVDQVKLNEAIGHLNQAPQEEGLTFVTKARAHILQGQLPSALVSYRRALQLMLKTDPERCGPNTSQGATPLRRTSSRIYLEMARMQYAPQSIRATTPASASASSKANDLFDRAITDVSMAGAPQLRDSEKYLKCAVDYDANNTEARLALAHLYLRLGSEQPGANSIDPPPFRKAEEVLDFYRDRGGRNVEGSAEAYYLLSRRVTLARQFQLDPTKTFAWRGGISSTGIKEGDAVQYAARAFNLTQRPLFKSQACLSQILFGVIGEQALCAASGDGNDLTVAYFHEGLYWLRRGQREGPGQRRLDSWARAIRAFNLGAERQDVASVEPLDPVRRSRPSLSELMLFGQRYTLVCIVKKDPGGDVDRTSQEVRDYFLYAGIPSSCGGSAS